MAMNGDDLGAAMLAAVQTLSSADQGDALKAMQKMGEAIVTYIHAHAQVSGVTAGSDTVVGTIA